MQSPAPHRDAARDLLNRPLEGSDEPVSELSPLTHPIGGLATGDLILADYGFKLRGQVDAPESGKSRRPELVQTADERFGHG